MNDLIKGKLNALLPPEQRSTALTPSTQRWPEGSGLWSHRVGDHGWDKLGEITAVQLESSQDWEDSHSIGTPYAVKVPVGQPKNWVEPTILVPSYGAFLKPLVSFVQESNGYAPHRKTLLRLAWDRWYLDYENVYIEAMPTISLDPNSEHFETAMKFRNLGRSILWNRETGERWCYGPEGGCTSHQTYDPATLDLPNPILKLPKSE